MIRTHVEPKNRQMIALQWNRSHILLVSMASRCCGKTGRQRAQAVRLRAKDERPMPMRLKNGKGSATSASR